MTAHLASAPGFTQAEGHTWYTELLLRPGRVYIFGGGHVAQALVPVLAGVEFRCVILEDRPEFCRPELFPGLRVFLHPGHRVFLHPCRRPYCLIQNRRLL